MRKSIAIVVASAIASLAVTDAAMAAPKTYGAVIKSNGARAPGKFSPGVTSKRLATGVYAVNFKVSVAKCIFSATVGSWNAQDQQGGSIKVGYVAGKPKTAKVVTISNGTAANRSFHLIVFCPK